jgi:6-pyruvoyltetrahydropterin/6-carboxytetrahydropterin synthase
MIADFATKIKERLPINLKLHSLKLQETESSYAEWVSTDNN